MTLTALVLSRYIHFAAAMLLWGGTCLSLGVPPRAGIDWAARRLALLNLFGAVGWFLAVSALAGEGPQDAVNPDVVSAMLTDTRFGLVWGPHLAILALVPGALSISGFRTTVSERLSEDARVQICERASISGNTDLPEGSPRLGFPRPPRSVAAEWGT